MEQEVKRRGRPPKLSFKAETNVAPIRGLTTTTAIYDEIQIFTEHSEVYEPPKKVKQWDVTEY